MTDFVDEGFNSGGILFRSSRPEVFLGKGVLKIYSKFTGEHLCRSAISKKVAWLLSPLWPLETLWILYFIRFPWGLQEPQINHIYESISNSINEFLTPVPGFIFGRSLDWLKLKTD